MKSLCKESACTHALIRLKAEIILLCTFTWLCGMTLCFFWCDCASALFTWKSNTHKKSDATFDRVVTTFTFNVSKPQKNKCTHIHCYWYVYSLKCHTHAHAHTMLTMKNRLLLETSFKVNEEIHKISEASTSSSCKTLVLLWLPTETPEFQPILTTEKSTHYAILLLSLSPGWQFLYCCFCHWHKLTKNPFTRKQTKQPKFQLHAHFSMSVFRFPLKSSD